MKVYTRTGDGGLTDLFGGGRVSKSHVRVRAFGEIDGANTAIGWAFGGGGLDDFCREHLLRIMKLLFCVGAEVATAPLDKAQHLLERQLKNRIGQEHVVALERGIDEMENRLSPLKTFILPTGTDAAVRLHCARHMVRKAEIALIELVDAGEKLRPEIIMFMNRLSDFLFVMARFANALAEHEEIAWSGRITD